MSGPAYVQRSRMLLGRIQQIQRELRHQSEKGSRDDRTGDAKGNR